jgi:cytoskeletal protein RodZ
VRSAPTARRTPVRGLVLLGLLVSTPVVWLLVPFTALVWWAAALVTGALVAMVAYQRHTVNRAREQRRRQARQELRSASQARRQSRRDVVGHVVAANRDRAAAAASADGVESASSEPESRTADGSWQPVPVPPPTYTLKPKAPAVSVRPAAYSNAAVPTEPAAAVEPVEPVTTPVVEPVPAVAGAAGTGGFDLDEILERRIAANG